MEKKYLDLAENSSYRKMRFLTCHNWNCILHYEALQLMDMSGKSSQLRFIKCKCTCI